MICEEASSRSKQRRTGSGVSDDRRNMDNCFGFDDLPKEILAEIMARLQPKSLMSLKSLNKSWYFVIRCLTRGPDFIAKQQSHAEARSTILLINVPRLLRHRQDLQAPWNVKHGLSKLVPLVPGVKKKKMAPQVVSSMFVTELVDNGGNEGNIRCVTENIYLSHLPAFLIRQRDIRMKVYHCNGVICLTNDFKTLTLYSPTTGDFRSFYPKFGGELRKFENRVVGMGLGSDPGANNFKVVRVFRGNRAQVFAPGTADSWRKIFFSIRGEDFRTLRDHLYSKGYCFWLTDSLSVLCFDVVKEAIHEVPFPHELVTSNDASGYNLIACQDSVCLFEYHRRDSIIEIWAVDTKNELGNGGFSYSWRKLLSIDRFEGFRSALAFWSRDEIVMETKYGKMVLYNVGTGKHKSLSINEFLGNQVLYFGHYVDSLASTNWMMKHISIKS